MTWDGRPADGVWHTVGAAGEPAFQNGWNNYDTANWTAARFRRDGNVVRLSGLIKDGAGNTFFTLPAGYRPGPKTQIFTAIANNGVVRVDVGPTGNVALAAYVPNTGASNAFISLDGITFIAEQ